MSERRTELLEIPKPVVDALHAAVAATLDVFRVHADDVAVRAVRHEQEATGLTSLRGGTVTIEYLAKEVCG